MSFNTRSGVSLFNSTEKNFIRNQGSSMDQLYDSQGPELAAVNQIKQRIMHKSQTAFQSRCRSKIKKGVAGTGKSDFVIR
jgi:hypothetical protein